MKFTFKILLILLYFSTIQSKKPYDLTNYPLNEYWTTVKDNLELAQTRLNESKQFIVFYHTTARKCPLCEEFADIITKFAKKHHNNFMRYLHVDCHELEKTDNKARVNISRCNREKDNLLPIIEVYSPPKNKFGIDNKMQFAEPKNYDGPSNIEKFGNFVQRLLPYYYKILETYKDLTYFLDHESIYSKCLVFLNQKDKFIQEKNNQNTFILSSNNDEDTIPIEIKGLSAEFQGYLDIAIIDESLDEILETYNIEKIPSIVFLVKEKETGKFKPPVIIEQIPNYINLRNEATKHAARIKSLRPEHSYFSKEHIDKIDIDNMKDIELKQKKLEEIKEKKIIVKELDNDNIDSVQNNNDPYVIQVHIYSQATGEHPAWQHVYQYMKGLAKLYEMNPKLAKNEEIIKTHFKTTQNPLIVYYPIGGVNFKKKHKKTYNKSVNFAQIMGKVNENYEDNSNKINDDNLRIFIASVVSNQKNAAMLYYDTPQSLLSYRAISNLSNYTDHFSFGSFYKPSKNILDALNIKKLPAQQVFHNNFDSQKDSTSDILEKDMKTSLYKGTVLFSDMINFFNNFSHQQKLDFEDAVKIHHIQQNYNFFTDCKKYRLCVFGVLKNDDTQDLTDKPYNKETKDMLQKLQRDLQKEHNIKFYYFDGMCYHDQLSKIGISYKNLPTVFAYYQTKNEFYLLKPDTDLSYDNIEIFVNKALRRKAYSIGEFPNTFQIPIRDCTLYKQKILNIVKRGQESERVEKVNFEEMFLDYVKNIKNCTDNENLSLEQNNVIGVTNADEIDKEIDYGMPDEKPKMIFVTGGPGSGKGTQCTKLVEKYNFEHLSTGDLLREEVVSGSEKGVQLQKIMSEGGLVPTSEILGLLRTAMKKKGWAKSTFLVDGFPRNSENMESFKNNLLSEVNLVGVLFFEVESETMKQRCLNRSQGRADDNIETIMKRLNTYVNHTLPMIEEIKQYPNFYTINAVQTKEEVFVESCTVVDKILDIRQKKQGVAPIEE